MRNPSILVVSLMGAVLFGTSPVSAEVSIAVAPAFLELQGRAGDTGRVEVNVSNSGDEPFEVVTAVIPFGDMSGDRSAVEWSSVSPERSLLEPGDRRAAHFTIDIPDDAASGGRYAQIAFSTVPPGADGTTAVAGRILVPVLLTVEGEGDLVPRPVLERAALFLEPDGRLGARVAVRNEGNAHVPLSGSIELTSGDPESQAALGIAPGRVLPGSTRTYSGDATVAGALATTYDVVVAMGSPDDTGTVGDPVFRETFQVDTTPVLELGAATVCENIDRGPSLTATLVNDGALGIVPMVGFEVFDEADARVGAAPAFEQPLAWPYSGVDAAVDLADVLPVGAYTLVASALFGGSSLVEARLPFTIGGDPLTAAPPCAAVTPTPSLTP
jgi:hypothetical protein